MGLQSKQPSKGQKPAGALLDSDRMVWGFNLIPTGYNGGVLEYGMCVTDCWMNCVIEALSAARHKELESQANND